MSTEEILYPQDLLSVLDALKLVNPTIEADFACYQLSQWVLSIFLGSKWVERIFTISGESVTKADRRCRDYLFIDKLTEDPIYQVYCFQRTINLAEAMYNSQYIAGAFERIKRLNKGEVRSVYSELRAASHFRRCGINFNLIAETGTRTYDIEIHLDNDRKLFCEVKAKEDDTPVTMATLINSLNDARDQIPKNGPGFIYLHIPQTWTANALIKNTIKSALRKFLSNNSRVAAVLVEWDKWIIEDSSTAFWFSVTETMRHQTFWCDDIDIGRTLEQIHPLHSKVQITGAHRKLIPVNLDYHLSSRYVAFPTFVDSYFRGTLEKFIGNINPK